MTESRAMQEVKSGLAQVQSFLEQVALWSEPEKAAAEDDKQDKSNVVNVMTLHASKGLEFAVVYIVGELLQLSSASPDAIRSRVVTLALYLVGENVAV